MKTLPLALIALVLLLSGCVWSPPAPKSLSREITLQTDSDLLLPVEVNGRMLRLQVSGGGLGGIILNPDAAVRAGLEGSPTELRVGSVRVLGESRLAPLKIGNWTGTQRVTWFNRPVEASADGTISLARLPYERVTLRLQLPLTGERTLRLQTENTFFADVNYKQEVAGEKITIRFEPDRLQSSASAAAGALLAKHHGGEWTGDVSPQPIAFGIDRPARQMRFARPLSLNGLTVDRLLVRTSDYGGKYQLPTGDVDPSEIIVTAAGGRQEPSFILAIGRDALSSCSSLTYERATRELTLSCREG